MAVSNAFLGFTRNSMNGAKTASLDKKDKPEFGSYHFDGAIDSPYVKSSTGKRITAAAGTLIVRNQLMSHGSCPNKSSQDRAAQFINVFSRTLFSQKRLKKRALDITRELKKQGAFEQLTELGRRIHGVE
jgi:hypothetical protein